MRPARVVGGSRRPQPGRDRGLYEAQIYRAARRLPELGVPGRPHGIGGVYDVADDWIPIYDRTALPGYYVAIGTSGNQFKNAPLVGQYLTAIIETCESGSITTRRRSGFHLPRAASTSTCRRTAGRRQPSAESSNTVMG